MNQKNGLFLLILLKNPISLVTIAVVSIIGMLLMSILGIALIIGTANESNSFAVACQMGDLDKEQWDSQFENAGAFTGMEDIFLNAASEHEIDPVLLASIAFHETGRGTSSGVRDKNNPGGIMNPATNWSSLIIYPSLEDGIYGMANNLRQNYIEDGLLTIDQIGSKYAPLDAENDPNMLNVHWVPSISSIVGEFGGLTMNCEINGFESGFSSPVLNMIITSHFGTRVHPIYGDIRSHEGIDFGCNLGDPIMGVLTGTVSESKYHSGWGNYVVLDHEDKYTLYAHLTESYVSVGDTVEQGMVLGACGSTGTSTNPHLHFEIHLGSMYGTKIDPLPYFQNNGEE